MDLIFLVDLACSLSRELLTMNKAVSCLVASKTMREKPGQKDEVRGEAAEVDGRQCHDQNPSYDIDNCTTSTSPSSAAQEPSGGPRRPRGPAGYAHLAESMTKTQHSIVRRYQQLSLQNLLYLQAEIHQLKVELDKETKADSEEKQGERTIWDFHWWLLATSPARGVGGGRRWDLWIRLRGRLGEYCASFSFLSLFVLQLQICPMWTRPSHLRLVQRPASVSLATRHPRCQPSPEIRPRLRVTPASPRDGVYR